MADPKETIDRLADEAMTKIYPLSTLGTQREAFRNVAREAIRAALAEPTEAMKEKMLRLALRTTVTDWNKYAGELWNEGAAERLKELG